MKQRKIGKKAPRSHVKGWQTLTEAAAQSGLSRQRIHILVADKRIPRRDMLGLVLVPVPLPVPKKVSNR
jgi:hypothetical protein